jgi:hypothetical protein
MSDDETHCHGEKVQHVLRQLCPLRLVGFLKLRHEQSSLPHVLNGSFESLLDA